MQKRIVCENLRSAYNVGNIIRTADGLGRKVILVGYTAPKEHKKVSKTALGAEDNVDLQHFQTLEEFYEWIKNNQIILISAEKTESSIGLDSLDLGSGLLRFARNDVELGRSRNNVESANRSHCEQKAWQHGGCPMVRRQCVESGLAVVMGNEVTGVEQSTLDQSDYIVHIPMIGMKESFNVGQAAAIMMREINQLIVNS